jgi:N-methylhydantoinase A
MPTAGRLLKIAVDIGGTFTDLVAMLPDGRFFTAKVSTTPGDYARAIIEGLESLIAAHSLSNEDIAEFLHATTICSNSILGHTGANVGLITTRGFRDILELRRLRMPRLYDLHWEKPPPLVPRHLRREVTERVDSRGAVAVPIDTSEVAAAIDLLLSEGVEVIAVSFLHAYANPDHERCVREIASTRAPGLRVCLSSDVLPEIREYERTSTTVINAYLLPVVDNYQRRLRAELDRIRIAAPIMVMQSGGGLTTDATARALPIHIVESGPAAGVIGAQGVARRLGYDKIISFDMGGTTAKASIIEDGRLSRAAEYQVGAGLMHGSRLLTGAGYSLRVPSIDLAEVGAGGGSHVSIDAGGLIRVGPTSAGAEPGPLCYDLGGTHATVTDANVLLGYLNAESLAGGSVVLNVARARVAFDEQISKPLGATTEQAAYAAHMIAASNMIRAIKAVSSERGRDPREYALFAFGGNGPVFAATIARTLQIHHIVIPPAAGVFSAVGLLYARVERHFVRTCLGVLRLLDPAELGARLADFENEIRTAMTEMGVDSQACEVERTASLRYRGQSFELAVSLPDGPVDRQWLDALEEAFGAEHERTYGHRADAKEYAELVTLNFVGRQADTEKRVPPVPDDDLGAGPGPRKRRAYFGPETGWLTVSVLRRADLAAGRRGPLIVEDDDSTCLIPGDALARLTADGSIAIDIGPLAHARKPASRGTSET